MVRWVGPLALTAAGGRSHGLRADRGGVATRCFAVAAAAAMSAVLAVPSPAQDLPPAMNDYPTEARAEYVFACMAVNGQTQDALRRCSCSIDVVASILPYDRYVAAETVLALRQTSGERVGMMRSAPSANAMVEDLRRAQAEGEIRCF